MKLYWITRNEEIMCIGSWWRRSEWETVIYPVPLSTVIPEAIWFGTQAEAEQLIHAFIREFGVEGFQAEPISPLFEMYVQQGQVASNFMARLFRPDSALLLINQSTSHFLLAQLFADFGLLRQILDMPDEYLRERQWQIKTHVLGVVHRDDRIFYSRDVEQELTLHLDQYDYFLCRQGMELPAGQWRFFGTFAELAEAIREPFKRFRSCYGLEQRLDILYQADTEFRVSYFALSLFIRMAHREKQGNIVEYVPNC